MTAQELYRFLNEIAPFETALEFDNPGLLVGDPEADAGKVLLSLDCTVPAVQRAKEIGARVILTHHPVIFNPLKKVMAGSVVWELIQSGITVISAHTNLDFAKGGVCDTLCALVGLEQVTVAEEGLRVGNTAPKSAADFAAEVGKTLGCRPRFTEGKQPVHHMAVCSGSGGSYLEQAARLGCDTLLTGDVKYSGFLDATERGINLIDAGHFETEQIILPVLEQRLKAAFAGIETEIFNCNPVKQI
ncbi:MAG: Nif3-like dinuclear metal center hexameric protein [Clostridia bacterium]|nr:Nif3-like dinuclear metal center hexameric protein [Clostridia bacterium]